MWMESAMQQPPLIFDFRSKTVSIGGDANARKAIAAVVAAQRAVIARSITIGATVTKS
jgi:hypothetical protein